MKYMFGSIPVDRSRVLCEMGNGLGSRCDVWARSEHSIYEQADSFVVGDVMHLGKIGSG